MSDWLDEHPDRLDWVAADVKQRHVEETDVRSSVPGAKKSNGQVVMLR